MATASQSIGAGANVALGLLLVVLAALIALRGSRQTRGRGALVAYLALVGANFSIDAGATVLRLAGADVPPTWRLANVASHLDPPFLLLFGLAVGAPKLRPYAYALFLPAAYTAYASAFTTQTASDRYLFIAVMAVCYGGAFFAVLRAWLREGVPAERDRLQRLVLALGVVVLPRVALFYVDLGYAFGVEGRARPETFLYIDGLLAVLFAATAIYALRTAPDAAQPHVRKTVRALASLLFVVEFVWLLRFFPGLREAAFALLYSVRWFLFAAVLSSAVRHEGLLGMPEDAQRRFRTFVKLALGGLALSEVAALLVGLEGVSLPLAVLGAGAVVGAAIAVSSLLRTAFAHADEASWRRLAVYRAHVDAGAPADELARVRQELGIDEREAREAQGLALLQRHAGTTRLAALSPGDLFLGRYEMGGLLGAGANGRVYAARDRMEGQDVVLKEVLGARASFLDEVAAAARVRHPNLVRFLGAEPVADGSAIVLERVHGRTLAARLAEGPLPPQEARRLARELLDALGALHAADVAHLDVKPENVMLRDDGSAVLLDFGAATRLTTGTRGWGVARAGTPGYMSPEQLSGARTGPPADVYAAARLLQACGLDGPAIERALADDPAARPTARELAHDVAR